MTDGLICDKEDTIDVLVKAASLPISVIIVGVGNEDFSDMEVLDGDGGALVSRDGVVSTRDLVQFVAYKDYGGDIVGLSKAVLKEIPD